MSDLEVATLTGINFVWGYEMCVLKKKGSSSGVSSKLYVLSCFVNFW